MRKIIMLILEIFKMFTQQKQEVKQDEPNEVQVKEEKKEKVILEPKVVHDLVKDKYVTIDDIETGIKYSSATDHVLDMKISKFFKLREALRYNSATQMAPLSVLKNNPHILENIKKQAANLDKVRSYYNKPLTPTSWFRTNYWNKKVGGVSNSQHLTGLATDFVVNGVTPEQIKKDWSNTWEGGMGTYNSFTHMDSRGHRARWEK